MPFGVEQQSPPFFNTVFSAVLWRGSLPVAIRLFHVVLGVAEDQGASVGAGGSIRAWCSSPALTPSPRGARGERWNRLILWNDGWGLFTAHRAIFAFGMVNNSSL